MDLVPVGKWTFDLISQIHFLFKTRQKWPWQQQWHQNHCCRYRFSSKLLDITQICLHDNGGIARDHHHCNHWIYTIFLGSIHIGQGCPRGIAFPIHWDEVEFFKSWDWNDSLLEIWSLGQRCHDEYFTWPKSISEAF